MSTLREFLAEQRRRYLDDVQKGQGREWIVCMGNEAGDLDSLASAIALAWCLSETSSKLVVPLVQTPRSDLHLRAENQHAMELAGLDPSDPPLLCIDDIPDASPFPSNKFALVDHNRLLTRFTTNNQDVKVVAIVDHHADEELYKDTADPRIVVVPIGSASSLVARLLEEKIPDKCPPELATLLLCGILVDTNGLKPGGKAEDVDRASAHFLLSHSKMSSSGLVPSDLYSSPELQSLTGTLQAKKSDISHFDTRDLLRRDYKKYTLTPSWQEGKLVELGLATIPLDLQSMVARDPLFWSSIVQYMDERDLHVLGLLTTYRTNHPSTKHEHGKHKREQLYVVREGVVDELADRIFDGLRKSDELDLKKRHLKDDYGTSKHDIPSGFEAKAWEQGNVHATRKATAPLLRAIIEGQSDKPVA